MRLKEVYGDWIDLIVNYTPESQPLDPYEFILYDLEVLFFCLR